MQQRYLRCEHRADRTRWHVLWLVSTGKSGNEAAHLVGRTSGWVRVLVWSYNKSGTEGVETVERKGQQWGGSEAALRWGTEKETELREVLGHATPESEVWTAVKAASWLSERRGRKVHLVTGWRTLQRLRQSMQLPRPQHPEAASPEDQATFQKNAYDTDGVTPGTA